MACGAGDAFGLMGIGEKTRIRPCVKIFALRRSLCGCCLLKDRQAHVRRNRSVGDVEMALDTGEVFFTHERVPNTRRLAAGFNCIDTMASAASHTIAISHLPANGMRKFDAARLPSGLAEVAVVSPRLGPLDP